MRHTSRRRRKKDIAEGVVAHLAAHDVPGQREHDHEIKDGDLERVGRCEEGYDQADQQNTDEDGDVGRACRWRLCVILLHHLAVPAHLDLTPNQDSDQDADHDRLLEFRAQDEAAELFGYAEAEA